MFFRYNFFGFLWLLLIVAVTLSPSGSVTSEYSGPYDKFIHGMLFMGLSLLFLIGFSKQYSLTWVRFNPIKTALIAANLIGVLIELGQGFIPGRYSEWSDLLANGAGTILGFGVFYVIYRL